MISEILKTLSEGELMAIADQLSNPLINETLVYKQLVSKSNNNDKLCDIFNEVNSDNFRGTLSRLVSIELSSRLKSYISDSSSRYHLMNPEE